jgi:hypothetical protein
MDGLKLIDRRDDQLESEIQIVKQLPKLLILILDYQIVQ